MTNEKEEEKGLKDLKKTDQRVRIHNFTRAMEPPLDLKHSLLRRKHTP